jgi:hypothetical protein
MIGFWPVEELAELVDRPAGCGEVARGGCFQNDKDTCTNKGNEKH